MAVTKYFEVYNNKNMLIIDDTFANFYLEQKVTGLIPAHANPDARILYHGIPTNTTGAALYYHALGEFLVYAIDTHQNKRFIAVSAPDNCVMTFRQDAGKQAIVIYPKAGASGFSGGSFSSEAARLNFWNSVCQNMKIYIFTTEPPTDVSHEGLVIYKDDGNVLFDANRKYMRVLDCINILGTDIENDQNTDLSGCYQGSMPQSFKSLAIMGFETPWRVTYTPQVISDYAHGIYISNDVVWHMHNQLQYIAPTPQGANVESGVFSTYRFLVIDVTGY
jgi:hypothetical protein|nr:MAG TPA: hypothetical protein [Caudoviricetes sp.]